MRTAPVALAYLHDKAALVQAATELSTITHWDPEAGEACVLWCLAIRHAVLTGEIDLRRGLTVLARDRQAAWSARIDEAESEDPSYFSHNGWAVQALQGAWSAISRTPVPSGDPAAGTFRAQHLALALEAAVRGGRDADTVAAIAGGLLGAAHGASAVPVRWRRIVHGWPGRRARDLVRLGLRIASGGERDRSDQPHMRYRDYGDISVLVRHPHDNGVWMGGFGALADLPAEVDAVVSLCQVGYDDVPAGRIALENRVEAWLIDTEDPGVNPNLTFALSDAADAVADLRAEGRIVYLHCVQAMTRTPAVASLYGSRCTGMPVRQALVDIRAALPDARPATLFINALDSFEGK